MDIVHMTAAYSNAVLLATLPYVADFAKSAGLPIPQPITTNQVVRSSPSPYKDYIVCALWLTNGDWFGVEPRGFVDGYRAPTNWFFEQEVTDDRIPRYFGRDNMTTNEALAMARGILLRLGWSTNLSHSYEPPEIEGPYDLRAPGRVQGHVPYCRVSWQWPKNAEFPYYWNRIAMDINLESKELVGFELSLSRTNTLGTRPIQVNVVPELESDYRKRTAPGKMFINSNAPPRFPGSPPPRN